jgi:putative oxidoreductase
VEEAMTAFYARLDQVSPYVLSILRIITGLLFLQHGLQKYFAFPSAGPHMRPLLYLQGIIEIAGGVLLAGGLYTRIVAFILSGDMAFAYFIAHFPRSFYPAVNGGDLAVLYCFVFLYIFFAGGGPWSLDRVVLRQDWADWQARRTAE